MTVSFTYIACGLLALLCGDVAIVMGRMAVQQRKMSNELKAHAVAHPHMK